MKFKTELPRDPNVCDMIECGNPFELRLETLDGVRFLCRPCCTEYQKLMDNLGIVYRVRGKFDLGFDDSGFSAL